MKIRTDYVTNSSSSSYIICFARIADEDKATKIIEKYALDVFDAEGVDCEKSWTGELGANWAGAIIWNVDEILEKYPDSKYVIIQDRNDAYEDDWGNVEYDYDFSANDAIDEITSKNGFDNIEVEEGEGRDG